MLLLVIDDSKIVATIYHQFFVALAKARHAREAYR